MEQLEILATRRTLKKGIAKHLRQQDKVPAVLYGRNIENEFLQVETLDLRRILIQGGASQLLYVKVDDLPEARPALMREVQRDIFTGDPTHVDFMVISMTEKITASIVVRMIGEPQPVILGTGILLQGANTIEVECLPSDLIRSFNVDVSGLELNEALYVSDVDAPDGIVILSDPQEMVAQIAYEKLAEEDEEIEGEEELFVEESPEVEVISKGRDEE